MTDAQCFGWDTKRVPSGEKCFDRNGDITYKVRTVRVVDRVVLAQGLVLPVLHFLRFSLSSSSSSSSSFVSVLNLTTIRSGFYKRKHGSSIEHFRTLLALWKTKSNVGSEAAAAY
jgi:hypothetical protein